MSWWDTSSISSLASQALKNAQKKIDKVLDIEAEEKSEKSRKKKKEGSSGSPSRTAEEGAEKKDGGQDFWYSWMGKPPEDAKKEDSSSTQFSSWNLPWGSSSQESQLSEDPSSLSSPQRTLLSSKGRSKREDASAQSESKNCVTSLATPVPASEGSEDTLVNDEIQSDLASTPRDNQLSKLEEAAGSAGSAKVEQTKHMLDSAITEQTEKSLELAEADLTEKSKDNSGDVAVLKRLSEPETSEVENVPVPDDSGVTCDTSGTDNFTPSVENFSQADSGWGDADAELEFDAVGDADNVAQAETEHLVDSLKPEEDLHINQSLCNQTDNEEVENSKELADAQYQEQKEDSLQGNQQQYLEKDSAIEISTTSADDVLHSTQEEQAPANSDAESLISNETFKSDDANVISDSHKCEPLQEKPDLLEDSVSGSSNISHSGLPDHVSEEAKERSDTTEGNGLSQEYVDIASTSSGSQLISMDSSAFSSEDCAQATSTEFDLVTTSGNTLDLVCDTTELSPANQDSNDDNAAVEEGRQEVDEPREPGYSLFDDGVHIPEGETVTSALVDGQDLPPFSSDVKSLIQEAMDDVSNKTEDSNSSNEAKSESSKFDSELEKSIYSGHESSDDIETTTSSDIEILSAPHSNGEAGAASANVKFPSTFDFTSRVSHHHSDSHSSSSTQSRAGDQESLSPDRGDPATWKDDDIPHQELGTVKEEGSENPYHPERLLKLAQTVLQRELQGGKKLADMAEVLQARENKLVQLSKENHELMEDANILRCQLRQAEEARDAEAADLNALTQEFTVRLGESEKKLQAVLKEKERAKQQLATAEKELSRRSADTDIEALLEEKSQQVEELLQEGEKLSKQQLQSSNIIKKLRAKEKESDATIASQKKKVEEQGSELEHLRAVLDSKEEMEKKQTEAITQLNSAVQRQEKELGKLKSDLEDAQEKSRGLQVALDNSYKEIAELHKSNASQDSKAQELALSAETHVREELRAAMEREQMKFKQEREAFIMQADDLRLDMARLEKENSRREDLLRQEIAHLQLRLQEDEARSQELTQTVSSATRPLLRQIENLQTTHSAQSSAWERVERNLTDRLAEAQKSLAIAQEKERMSSQRYMELSASVAALESTNTSLRQEKVSLVAKMEGDKNRLEELQDVRNSFVAQIESSKKILSEEVAQLKQDKVHLEYQLTLEKTRLETEKKKSVALEEQLRLAEHPRSRGTPSPSPSMSISRQESIAGSVHEGYPGALLNWSFQHSKSVGYFKDESDSGSTVGVGRTSVYESLRQSGAAIVVENMSSQLKLREGEISHLQSEISQLERTRESMARELVNLSNQNDELQEDKLQHEQLQAQFNELNQRYSAILQMYGEKEERVQELTLDLQDIKEMYKSQIDALLAK